MGLGAGGGRESNNINGTSTLLTYENKALEIKRRLASGTNQIMLTACGFKTPLEERGL